MPNLMGSVFGGKYNYYFMSDILKQTQVIVKVDVDENDCCASYHQEWCCALMYPLYIHVVVLQNADSQL